MDRQKSGLEKLQQEIEEDKRSSLSVEDSAYFFGLGEVVKLMLDWERKLRAKKKEKIP